ncbi:MAG: hypothetical protein IPH85_03615 [Ignavibacteria bacterium]|nr:hypothetical protein [Ignavibacteria bacterium]MBK6420089.1 hypothetical protein [Ignavibacteria bacterium]MBK6759277.1 hypothetical protein [Ignavibacteria bacterium]MBK7185005.1 hypothetical protein [Ignavibacteria bacterium]MBK7576453.1 hypothetical protein [Ignavibacteria bacterium]
MSTLPPVQPPDDFERVVYLRSLLSSLPPIETPVSFEDKVLKKARSGGAVYRLLIVATTVLGLLGGVVWWTSQPNITVVRAVNQIESPTVDLYDLPPVPVEVDKRYEKLRKKKTQEPRFGVAGH